jgi:tyrosyl-tRNA synthetase
LETWYSLLLRSEAPADLGPRDAKRALARSLVERFYDASAAAEAEREFDRVHLAHELPEEMPFVDWPASQAPVHLPALLQSAFGISTSEARRALAQGGVRLDGEAVANGSLDLPVSDVDGKALQLGKRRFARVRVK